MAHPLSDFVMSAFTPEKKHHDEIAIACFLAGATYIRIPKSEKNGMDAYTTVAKDVLGCLVQDGRLHIDRQGWYVRKAT
jgi:hypothetical protein